VSTSLHILDCNMHPPTGEDGGLRRQHLIQEGGGSNDVSGSQQFARCHHE